MKKIIPIILLLSLIMIVPLFAVQDKKQYDASVVLVLDKGQKSRTTKHLYKALNSGLKKAGFDGTVKIEFIATIDAKPSIFDTYDAVVVVNEGTTESLSDLLNTFVISNKDRSNMVVMALVPKGRTKLATVPEGVDVISSASKEKPASTFIVGTVSKKVKKILDARN